METAIKTASGQAGRCGTMRRLLDEEEPRGPQEQQFLELVYRRTLRQLSLIDRGDPACEIIARKIMEIHGRGATNAIGISEIAIRELGFSEHR